MRQFSDGGGPRQAAVGGGVGLGPDVAQRLHGRAVVRRVRAGQGRGRRLVQAAQSGGGRVLRRAVSRRGRAERRRHAQGRRTIGILSVNQSIVYLLRVNLSGNNTYV